MKKALLLSVGVGLGVLVCGGCASGGGAAASSVQASAPAKGAKLLDIAVLPEGDYVVDHARMDAMTLRRFLYDMQSDLQVRVVDASGGNTDAVEQLHILLEQKGITPVEVVAVP
ncbi:MAG: hypothetical protein ACFB20_13205 [Opitutales bacterium]